MMKKITLVSLFLALLATFSARAQENTYNMVIEMTNGTKINIGPNDIRSLTFNDGQLVVTGGDLQAWMEMVENDITARMRSKQASMLFRNRWRCIKTRLSPEETGPHVLKKRPHKLRIWQSKIFT